MADDEWTVASAAHLRPHSAREASAILGGQRGGVAESGLLHRS